MPGENIYKETDVRNISLSGQESIRILCEIRLIKMELDFTSIFMCIHTHVYGAGTQACVGCSAFWLCVLILSSQAFLWTLELGRQLSSPHNPPVSVLPQHWDYRPVSASHTGCFTFCWDADFGPQACAGSTPTHGATSLALCMGAGDVNSGPHGEFVSTHLMKPSL